MALIALVAPMGIYAGLLVLQPSDPFGAWHAEIVWPARHFLTDGSPGLLLPAFAFLLLGTVGTLVAATVALGVGRGIGRVVRVGRLGDWMSSAVLVLMPIWAFVWVKAIPPTVTVVARDPARLEVHHFGITRLPSPTQVIARDQIVAFELAARWQGRSMALWLELAAQTRSMGSVVLGARECRGGRTTADVEACATSGEPGLGDLATALDLAPTGPVEHSRPGRRSLGVTVVP